MNWDNPEERLALIERVGIEEYKRLHAAHLEASTVGTTVKGRAIRTVMTRFGLLYAVDGTRVAFSTLDAAQKCED
jgi:hypothetical protein